MRIDRCTDRPSLATALFIGALALAAPHTCGAQGPEVRSDSTNQAPASTKPKANASAKEDTWYPEGFLRIRGKRYSFFAGASYSWYISGASRSRFGQGEWSPSFELYRPPRHGFSPIFELNGTETASGDSTARVLGASVGVRYRPMDAERSRWLVLSVGIAAGPRVARISGRQQTTLFGASAQVGLEVLRTARVTFRYELLPLVHGTRLSTMSLGTAVRLPPYGRHGSYVELQDRSPTATCAPTGCAR